jgi:Holliday junction resolvase RusA-like endonuclease
VIWPSVDFLRSLNKKRKREQKQRLKQLIDNLVKSIIDQQIYLEKKKKRIEIE